ncbi:unnamed protein product [Larinioides sclopetarius]|uniref:separase n=1 Tax=Larinioides sclopetarius TaxID=280406 RepID=A0AAV1ZW04_9ARAC
MMLTVKAVIANLKNGDVSSLLEDIQVLLKSNNGKISCVDLCNILKATYQSVSTKGDTEEDSNYSFILKVVPCINLCIDYIESHFSLEDAVQHQILLVLFHIVTLYMKFELYSPAFACAEYLMKILSNKQRCFSDANAYIINLGSLFWNEGLKVDKKADPIDFEMGFKFRSKAMEFMMLNDNHEKIYQKIPFTLIRYCHNNKKQNPDEIIKFLKNVWTKPNFLSDDKDYILSLFKLFYSLFEVSVKYVQSELVLKFLFSLLLELSESLESGDKKLFLKICIEIVKLSMQFYFGKDVAVSEKAISDFQKIITTKEKYEAYESTLLSYTCGFFYLCFTEFVNVTETKKEKILSSVQNNVRWYISLVYQYLSVSSDEHFHKYFPFGPKADLTISKCSACFFAALLKEKQDVNQKQELMKEARNFVKFSIARFKSANLTNELKKYLICFLTAISNIGFALYKLGLYFESTYFLEVCCDMLFHHISPDEMEDLKPSLWKKNEILIYCYFLSGNHKAALLSITKLILIFSDKRKECLELWRKVKRDASRMNNSESVSIIISDLLSEMEVSLSAEDEVFLLMEELKIYKTERCSTDEDICRVAVNLLNISCSNYDQACSILEILTMPLLLAEKISKTLNKPLLDLCLENIDLIKSYVIENPTNEAKLLLSVNYFCLYCFNLQELHRIAESEAEASLKSRSEDEENETCDIKPAFPLVTFLIEAEVVKNLEMALEIWMGISKDLNCDWKELTEVINNWSILSIINTTAEIFSTSAYDICELRSWILLWTVASSIKNKEYRISSSISLADFLLKCGYSDTAFELFKLVENDSLLNESCTNQILLRLKLQLTKSKFYLQKAKFDEGLILLLDILQNPVFEKKLKHVKLLKAQCLMLQTEFLLVPIYAFSDPQNLEYLQIHTIISSAMECANLSTGLWKVTLDKQNSDSSNDGMFFKTLLLRNLLKAYLLLAEEYFSIGDPRFARCYLKEGLKIAQGHILTFWASKMLIILAKIDLLCHNPTDCLVKLNGLKYIMDQDTKKNASLLLSKIDSMSRISECIDESDDFIIPSGTNLNLRRGIKQNYIDSNVHASPISTKIENSEFEVKLESYANGSMFSIFLLKLEIWALSCLHLIVEDRTSFAKSQLKKLVQRCEILKKKNKSFVEALIAGKFELPVPSLRKSCKSETKLLSSAFLELSLIYFSESDFKSSNDYLKLAFNSLSDSCEKENHIYPIDYALLNYHQIVITLKNDLKISSNDCLEYKICPSVKNKYSFARRVLNSEKSAMNMYTPTKCPQISITPCLTKGQMCHAPSKKDILPRHLKKDMEGKNSNSMKSLLFSSSDDDFSGLKTPSPLKVTLKNTRAKKNLEKSSSSYLKPKNAEKSIEASCDIWKCRTLFSPEASKENKKILNCEIKPRNLRQTRQRNRNKVSDSSHSQILNSTKTSKRNKTSKSNLKNAENLESVGNNSYGCCDLTPATFLAKRTSIEYNRCSSKNRLKYEDSPKNDDVFYSDCPEVISKEGRNFSPDELCKNFDSMGISLDRSLNISVERLTECIEKLKFIRSLVEHIAPYPLYANICRLLAVLLIVNNKDQPRDSDSAFMLSETFSSTLRQIHLSNVLFYKDKLINGDRNCIIGTLRRNNQPVDIQMDNILQAIPKDYTIVQISAIPDEEFKLTSNSKFRASKLIVCRYQHNRKPIVMCINSSSDEMFNSKLFPDFEKTLLESTLIMKQNDDTKKWWKTRSTLDSKLKSMVGDMEDIWFGCWKGLLLSKCINKDRLSQLMKICDSLPKTISSDENLLLILLDSVTYLSREQLKAAICHLWNCSPLSEVCANIYKSISELSTSLPISKRHPLILILDKNIQALPWESLPLLKDVPVSRIPSLIILKSLCTTLEPLSYKEVDCNNTFYILNPSGDLKYSEEYFKHQFEKQANWKGITGRAPVPQEFSSAFKSHDLFVYCGHGSGRQYLDGISIDTMKCRAATILMGCSSGRLKQLSRQLEAYGIPLSYLMNGCPFVIGNLWDVTDKDIDRFTDKLLELFVPNYCQNQNSITDIADAVRQARNACKMRYLVGAAPIMYGLPTIAKS